MVGKEGGHIVQRFDAQLGSLKGLVLEMGQLVLQQLREAQTALENGDTRLARQVVHRDRDINAFDMKGQELCLELLATRQPVASDLRFVMAMSQAINNLERAADEAKKLGRTVLEVYGEGGMQPVPAIFLDAERMTELATELLEDALEAVQELDVDKAVAVVQGDQLLNDTFHAGLRRLATFLFEDARNVRHVIEAVFVLKALERIGDHASNIAEFVIYAVKGKDVRYVQSEHLSSGYLDAD
jgi:phosphate transport system protein